MGLIVFDETIINKIEYSELIKIERNLGDLIFLLELSNPIESKDNVNSELTKAVNNLTMVLKAIRKHEIKVYKRYSMNGDKICLN